MRARDKRAAQIAVFESKRHAANDEAPPEDEVYASAPDWWLELDSTYTEPTGEDLSYLEARRMHG